MPVTSAVAVAAKMGLASDEIISGLAKIQPVFGRMNFLRGVEDSILIDDTYNSSPAAAEAALRTLYNLHVPSRIAILGDMNELGSISAVEHQKIGNFCDPLSLSWVITVGDKANQFLAAAARNRGCQVKTCANAIEAATFARKVMEKGCAILLKGSQGGIFLEEATKILLKDKSDISKLVRQDEKWTREKNDFFETFSNFEEDEV